MNEIITLLREKILDADIDYQASGSRLVLNIKAAMFKDMNRIQRQRYVKQILAPFIESGQLHAVSLKVGVKDE